MIMQTLDGAWRVSQAGSDDSFPAKTPGCIHLDLLNAKEIGDPFYGDNEYRIAWIARTDWVYTRTFVPDASLLGAEKIVLECDGLDTLCTLELNGEVIGCTDNMYIAHRFDVSGKLAAGENELRITFKSAVNYGEALMCKDVVCPGDSIPGSVFVRKAPSQYGWDWGPKIPTSGIWRPIRLAGYSVSRIDDLRVEQTHEAGRVTLNVTAELENYSSEVCSLSVRVIDPDGTSRECPANVSSSIGECEVTIDSPKLWWPNGYGDQPLYQVEATLSYDGKTLDVAKRQIGLRTIELDQTPDQWGKRFAFVVNGVPVFCKGADWIPADQFPSRLTEEHYRHLIKSSVMANMNMLRIWGGGFYEDEVFYDLCDEYGILVWQDFMFACGHYPVDAPFLANVARETEAVVRRLRNRACMALWCGNNEMEWGVGSWWGGEGSDKRKADYPKIFHETIPSVVERVDPHIAYWPSSPSSGIENYCKLEPNDQNFGDGHYWDVWHGRKPFTAYREQFHRFMSEFGFESMPAIETVRTFAGEEDLNMTSYVMECHQKNGGGNGLILYYMAQTFRFPKDFEMMCYTSQLLQAEAMRYGVEHWRRNRNDLRCMGALYWQLNDCWPVSSWASIDYFGRWKATQYFARRFNESLHLSVCEEGKTAKVHVTNDLLAPVEVEIKWSLEKLDGTVLSSGAQTLTVAAELDTLAADLDFTSELSGDAVRETVLVCEMTAGGKPAGSSVTTFVPSKHVALPEVNIALETGTDAEGQFIRVTTDKTARYVCLAIPGRDVIFSDNYFDLAAGRTNTVRLLSEVEPEVLATAKVYSLRDSY